MINILSGHLGSGHWKIKQQSGTYFLSHRLPFSPSNEYRIGCDEVLEIQVEEIKKNQRLIKIVFTDNRDCRALVDEKTLEQLQHMVNSSEAAPVDISNKNRWIIGVVLFSILCIVFEIVK